MKKALTIILVLFLFFLPLVAQAETNVVTFLTDYGKWASRFGASDVSAELFSAEAGEDGIAAFGMDDVDIAYDAKTWEVKFCTFWFSGRHGETNGKQQSIRLSAFIAALEYGPAGELPDDATEAARLIIEAKNTAAPIVDDFTSCVAENSTDMDGKLLTFHISENHLYQFLFSQEANTLIIYAY